MERRGDGKMIVIEADDPSEALELMKTKLGEDGYIQNMVIDYHRSSGSFGNVPIEGVSAASFFSELKNGYAGIGTLVYLGQCWAGGNSKQTNLTVNVSQQLDGATVYGHKSQASSLSFYFFGHFSRYVPKKEGAYKETEEYKNVGIHVVSFYNPVLMRVSSVEIKDKIKILNNGQIHSSFNQNQLQNLPEVTPNTTKFFSVPREIAPPALNEN
jgi:hypothetical protein